MSMNYCPRCGNKLQGDTKYCPFCGAYLKEDNAENKNDDNFSMNSSKKDSSWVDKWNDRARANKIGLLVLFFVLIPALIIPMVRLLFEIEDMLSFLWPLILLELFIISIVVICFVSIIKRKNVIRVIDGYTVLVFITSSQHALIVEDEMQDSQAIHNSRYYHTRPINLHGHLPNGRKIYADFENKVNGVEVRFED